MHYSYIIPTGYTCYTAISVIPSQTSIRDLATFSLPPRRGGGAILLRGQARFFLLG